MKSNGTADQIIRAICNEYRNSDLRADDPDIRRRLNERFAVLEAALRAVRASFWSQDEPRFVDHLLNAEDRCWEETGIAPPGRSVSMHRECPPDDVRRDTWWRWIAAERTKALALVDAALADTAPEAPKHGG